MSEVLQARFHMPLSEASSGLGLGDYINERLDRMFFAELGKWLKENNGGVVGPINRTVEPELFFDAGTTHTMHAHVEALPAAPEFQMLGGPADKRILRTGGGRHYLIPLAPSWPEVAGYMDSLKDKEPLRYAEYERIGDSQAYRYMGTR